MNQQFILKVVLVQFNPIFKNVVQNIKTLDNLLKKYQKENKIGVVLLPEMALTGYCFDSKDEVGEFLENKEKGQTFDFCSSLSNKLNCYVFCGFPEKEMVENSEKYYNSCLITDRNGKLIKCYRKSFLYETDKNWCIEGSGFDTIEIESNSGKKLTLGLGICMDINPYEFKAPFEKFEFANYCLNKNVDCVVLLANWLLLMK